MNWIELNIELKKNCVTLIELFALSYYQRIRLLELCFDDGKQIYPPTVIWKTKSLITKQKRISNSLNLILWRSGYFEEKKSFFHDPHSNVTISSSLLWILKKCFLGTTFMVTCVADLYIQIHYGVKMINFWWVIVLTMCSLVLIY